MRTNLGKGPQHQPHIQTQMEEMGKRREEGNGGVGEVVSDGGERGSVVFRR